RLRLQNAMPVQAFEAAASRSFAWLNSASISRLNAGMSSGLRLVTSWPSTTTSLSTQFAPALRRAVFNDGQDVRLQSRTTSASMSVHGPWQIAATGLAESKNVRTNDTALEIMRN